MKPKKAHKNNGAVSKKGSKKVGKTSSIPPYGADGSILEKLDSINANQEKAAKSAATGVKIRALEFFARVAKGISEFAESDTTESFKEWVEETFGSIPEDLEEWLK